MSINISSILGKTLKRQYRYELRHYEKTCMKVYAKKNYFGNGAPNVSVVSVFLILYFQKNFLKIISP